MNSPPFIVLTGESGDDIGVNPDHVAGIEVSRLEGYDSVRKGFLRLVMSGGTSTTIQFPGTVSDLVNLLRNGFSKVPPLRGEGKS